MKHFPTHFMRLALPNKYITRKENERSLSFMNINAKKTKQNTESSKILKSSDSTAKSYKCKTDLIQRLKISQCNSPYKLKKNHAVIPIDAHKSVSQK